MTAALNTPHSEKITLVAATAKVVTGAGTPVTVHIPTGTSLNVYTTCAANAEIIANTADWVVWPNGVTAGPFMDTLLRKVTAIKFLSVAGGTVYLVRS